MLKRLRTRRYLASLNQTLRSRIVLTVLAILVVNAEPALSQQTSRNATIAQGYGQLPMTFEANQGQTDTRVKFTARGKGYGLYLTAQEAVLTLHTQIRPLPPIKTSNASTHYASQGIASRSLGTFNQPVQPANLGGLSQQDQAYITEVLRLQLANANLSQKPMGEERLPGIANYIRGSDPAKWHTNIPTYREVRYAAVYPGVDLIYYGNQNRLEYDFVIAPGASAKPVKMHFDGARTLTLADNGDLNIAAAHGAIVFKRPVMYQNIAGARKTVEGSFKLLATNSVGFSVGRYNHTEPLIIDPVLMYSTYFGGSSVEFVTSVAAGPGGAAYVSGLTFSEDFPLTSGAFQAINYATATSSVSTAFISKFNASGTALLYSTYLGGNAIAGTLYNQGDYGKSIAVDNSGDAFVAGYTYSKDFPVTGGAFQVGARQEASEAPGFVTKLNPTGTGLLYSTYLGGNILDEPLAVTIDGSGDAFVSGITYSTDFPTTAGAFQATNKSAPTGSYNQFVTKLNPGGTSLVYSTYLGGTHATSASIYDFFYTNPIVVDASGNAYVAAFSDSSDFPTTTGAFQIHNNGIFNATLTKINPTGTALVYSTYLGGSTNSYSQGLVVDSAGNAYIAGFTSDTDFPVTAGSFQQTNHAKGVPYNDQVSNPTNTNGFLAKVNPAGSALIYSTYLGGSTSEWGGDQIYGLALDTAGDAIVAGLVTSADFPVTSNAYQPQNNGATHCCVDGTTYSYNAFITQLNPSGSALLYSTYFGGSGEQNPYGAGPAGGDAADDIALSSTGELFMVGYADSTNFPTTSGALDTVYHSQQNMGFVTAFNFGTPPATAATLTTLKASGNPVVPGTAVTFTAAVVAASGSDTPTGNIVFAIDEANVATVGLTSGKGTYSVSNLSPGEHYILATYTGSATYSTSGSGFNEVIQPVLPLITPISGTYTSEQIVTISDSTPSSVVYYTLDGTTPSIFSMLYTAPFLLPATRTVNAVAISGNDANSNKATSVVTIIGSPLVLGAPATAIATPAATLNAFVNTLGLGGTYIFHYGTSSTSLNTATSSTALPAASARVQAAATLSGLTSKMTYFYQVTVNTPGGVTSGPILSFTTN
jgi:hypothetical protein